MIQNYLKIAWRNLWKNKSFPFINISGLAIGMASFILLLSYVAFQFSYDNFHSNRKNIYRVALNYYQNNKLVFKSAENYSAVGPALKKDFPEIVDAARLYNMGYKNNCVFTCNDKSFKETKFLYADPSFLTMFSFPFVEGDPKTALIKPNMAVISESVATKIFGNKQPVGKFIRMDDDDRNSELCEITGVFKDVPENSHIKFNVLISFSTLHSRKDGVNRYENNWNQKDYYTYILLRPNSDPKSVEAKFPSFIDRRISGEKANRIESKFTLQPLEKIHLTSDLNDEPEVNGNGKAITFLIIIAFFTITIAWVNYINLSTAGSVNRAKEIGVRKVLGSSRSQLMKQFLIESLSLNMISFIVATLLVVLLKPFLHSLFNVEFPLSILYKSEYGLAFTLFLLAGSFFSGLYPAFVLSSFRPATVLKGKMSASKSGVTLRKSLVIFQFSLSIFLIIGTLIVYQQVNYMLNQNLGMNVNQVLIMDRPGRWDKSDSINSSRVQLFKQVLKGNPAIETVGMADAIPGKEIRSQLNYRMKDSPDQNPIAFNTIGIDEDYVNVLGINMLAGRNFSLKYKTDENGLIIAESASKLLGYKKPQDAIGKQMLHNNISFTILGVTEDFHHQSLEKKTEPVIFQFNGIDYEADEYYLVKIKTASVRQTVANINSTWNKAFGNNPFNFFFLDAYFNQQYQSEVQFGILFGTFSIIAIIIACIGLFALVAFMIEQRTKEIGVRKVLGAGIRDVIILLTKDFVKLVLLANIVAWPLAWLLMTNWLKDFAYHISIHWWVFMMAGLSTVIIALITISLRSVKAALANPVKSLKSE